MKSLLLLSAILFSSTLIAEPATKVLFDGTSLEAWEFAKGAWEIEEDGSMVCRMETAEGDDGTTKTRSMGYIWTKEDYGDFELELSYRISEGANSGVFYRSDKKDPVHQGFEIQLMDDEGYQKSHGPLDARKLNGSFYEGKAAAAQPAKGPGQRPRPMEHSHPEMRRSAHDLLHQRRRGLRCGRERLARGRKKS